VDPLIAWIFRLAVRMLSLLSLASQRRVGRTLGALAWRMDSRHARVTRTNIDLCFPELSAPEKESLGKASLQHTAQLFTESGVVFHWPKERWAALIKKVEGESLIRDAMSSGSGVLMLAPHFGNWEFLSLYLGQFALTALYDPPRIRALEGPIVASRRRSGLRLIPIGTGGLKALYRTLRQSGVAALLPDQVPERRAGVYAPFFDRPALTMTIAHRLIQRTRPRVLFCAAVRIPDGFGIRISEADPLVGDADVLVSATAMNRSIETLVREDPAQYQWEYKRFKRQPPDQPKLYRDS